MILLSISTSNPLQWQKYSVNDGIKLQTKLVCSRFNRDSLPFQSINKLKNFYVSANRSFFINSNTSSMTGVKKEFERIVGKRFS